MAFLGETATLSWRVQGLKPMGRVRTTAWAWAFWGAAAIVGVARAQPQQYLGPCALVAASDGKTLYVANADHRQIAWVELPGGNVTLNGFDVEVSGTVVGS